MNWRGSVQTYAPVAIFIFLALDQIWVTEDAYITFQSVENLWAGFGPNFNRGLRVESYSHPLWFVILCLLRVFGRESLPLLAALTGIALSGVGLALSISAARKRLDQVSGLYPLGGLVVAVLYPFWQFASSGLETGLTFFWLGLSFYGLVVLNELDRTRARIVFGIIGLGPIIRPDLAVFAAPLVLAAVMLSGVRSLHDLLRREVLIRVGIAASFGLVWQIFRMGYYGALIPNTYIAKEGLGARWDQGYIYLVDLMRPYWLAPVVLALIGLALKPALQRSQGRVSALALDPVCALIIGAVVHGLMVCRSGGDFMHARLLLPALFAVASAGAVVRIPVLGSGRLICLTMISLWAGYVCLLARPEYASQISSNGIADERQWYVTRSATARPTSLKDYEYHSFYRVGEAATLKIRKSSIRAIYWAHIGIASGVIPDDVIIIDPLALNDHIGSRIRLLKRGRPGHEKIVPAAWFVARYPAPDGLVITNQLNGAFAKRETPERIEAARTVLSSPELSELNEAVTAPLTLGLFLRNALRAWRLTFLRIDPDPVAALERS